MTDGILPRAARFATFALAAFACGIAAAEPAMWTVKGRENTVYLFGSVHALPPGGFSVEDSLGEAWKDAERVCLEIDLGATDDAKLLELTLARAIDPEGRDLFTLLGDDAARARSAAESIGISLEPLATFEPWFVALTVSMAALQQHGYDAANGVDKIVDAAARRDSKPICAFETADEQLALFDGLPAERQNEFLFQSIEEAATIEAEMRELLSAWNDGDEARLSELFERDFADYGDLLDPLLNQRNARWVAAITRLLDGQDDVMVVVGAGHLFGNGGLPALLEARGFEVARR